jgi:hypothetical protein
VTTVIKAYLTPQQVSLQLDKPHNHRVNAAERAIQTFKNRFIRALGTTDANFPIQLWDKLTPQVQDYINLLFCSRVHPDCSAYKTLEGLYDWNRYPMAPPGTMATIYKDSNTRTSRAPHGLDTWLLGPSKDYYRCHLYYVPETSGYWVSGSANLFPQHCSAPPYLHKTHIQKLATELEVLLQNVMRWERASMVLRTLVRHLNAFASWTPLVPIQLQLIEPLEEQRVIPITTLPQSSLQRVNATPPTLLVNISTARCILQTKPLTHLQNTRNNSPGALSYINHAHRIPVLWLFTDIPPPDTLPTPVPTATLR